MNPIILEVNSLSKSYEQPVLNNLSFQVSQGESVAVIGANGAGKSTLFKILLKFCHADLGTFKWFPDQNLNSFAIKQKVAYLPESPIFWGELSVQQLLRHLSRFKALSAVESVERIEKVLKVFGLKNRSHKKCNELSKGMRQRLALAQLFLSEAEVYVLDEPMSGLDPAAQEQLCRIVNKLKDKGKSFILSTHNTDDMRKLCSRALVLDKGKIMIDTSVKEALSFITQKYNEQSMGEDDPMEDINVLF